MESLDEYMWSPQLRGESTGLFVFRLGVGLLLVVTLLSIGQSFLTNDVSASTDAKIGSDQMLVAVIDGTGPGQVVAYHPNGTVAYQNRTYLLYHDVDPSPVGKRTVTYVASEPVASDRCRGTSCLLNTVERVNLTTGAVTRLYTQVDTRNGSSQIHDVDRINESVLLVADINFPDRVFMVNTTTGAEIWEWRVSEAYSKASGGSYPTDWTHINDVEYLSDGRIMANLRNQDQVVFLRPGSGIQENWTLGTDGTHRILHEQHNADYIPRSRGGPAVLVADSENNRVVEYQRTNGSWVRSWRWQDAILQWPRDADRLPSGKTLVADSHGSRLLAIDERGEIAWSRPFPDGGYDVELLGTGDESTGGESATQLGLESHTPGMDGPAVTHALVSLVPPLILHGLLFALPTWTTAIDATLIFLTLSVGVVWLLLEIGMRLRPRLRAVRE